MQYFMPKPSYYAATGTKCGIIQSIMIVFDR